jgi:6-phosphofructo-2-kinase/fructose-2,6-biphosphatase 2
MNHGIQVLFIESLCDDDNLIRENIRDVKLTTSSTTTEQQEKAIDDYLDSINNYKDGYETISEQDYTYIQLINAGQHYVINQVHGYLESRIVYYLLNLSIKKKRIWFSRVSGSSSSSTVSDHPSFYVASMANLNSTYKTE